MSGACKLGQPVWSGQVFTSGRSDGRFDSLNSQCLHGPKSGKCMHAAVGAGSGQGAFSAVLPRAGGLLCAASPGFMPRTALDQRAAKN